jgi:hypothetical protein
MIGKLLCWLGRHDWKIEAAMVRSTFKCARCGKTLWSLYT